MTLAATLALTACAGQVAERLPEDSFALTSADLGTKVEARHYLQRGGGVWSEDLDGGQVRRLIDVLYGAGCERVMFAGIDLLGEAQLSSWLVAEMPRDSGARAKVLAAFNKMLVPLGIEAVRDNGQQFVDVTMG